MNLHINTPCHEDWATMSPTQQGRFCSSCQKEVHNFSKHSLLEIKQFFEGETGTTCGRFSVHQLEVFNAHYQPLPTPSRIKQWAVAAILTAVAVAPSFGQTPVTAMPRIEHTPPPVLPLTPKEQQQPTITNKMETISLSGSVVRDDVKEIIPLANIWVVGTETGITTDMNGQFHLELPFSEEAITLQISCFGYDDLLYTIIPNKNQKTLVFAIKENLERCIKGLMIAEPVALSPAYLRKATRASKRQARKERRNNRK